VSKWVRKKIFSQSRQGAVYVNCCSLVLALFFAPGESAKTAGKKAFDSARYQEAIRIWQSGDPEDCEIPFYIGLAQYRLQRVREALIQFRAAVACAPNGLLPRIALAQATAASGDQSRALAHYEDALKIDPDSIDAVRGAAFLSVANQLNDKAVGLLERLLKLAPNDAAARAQLGAVYAALGRMEAAEAALKSALEQDPENQSALIGLANVYLKTGRTRPATDLLEKAIVSVQSFEPAFLLGSAYSSDGRYEDAVRAFRRAIELDPSQAEVYYQMATALGKLNRTEERTQALQRFRELKARVQKSGEDTRRAARLVEDAKPYVDRGDLVQALRLLEEAHSLQPDSGDILFRMAGLQYDLRRYAAARGSVMEAIRRTPDEWNYYLLLGLIEKDVNQFAASRQALQAALRLHPGSADIHNHLGDVAMRQSQFGQAVDHFQNALKLAPDDHAFLANLRAAQAAADGK
jgi:superkiller protein 3